MKYQLVLQFQGEQIEDFDELLKLEFDLGLSLKGKHIVDGHDFGSGEMNIFIHTDNPEEALSNAKASLDKLSTKNYIVAFRDIEGENYTVLFPSAFEGLFCVK
jgi:hypothetical protein